jgi:hypothetical protein
MYIEADFNTKSDNSLRSQSFVLPTSGELKFWYHMFTSERNHILQLQVRNVSSNTSAGTWETVWSKTGPTTDVDEKEAGCWREARVSIPKSVVQVQFHAEAGDDEYGDIAVDDITFTCKSSQAAGGPPGAQTCDASTPPTNGMIGDCTSNLADGSTCQPQCNTGYTPSGTSSCVAGVFTAATCQATTTQGR